MNAAGVSWQQLAERLNKTYSSVYNSVKRAENPTMPVLEQVAEALGCRVSDLLDEGVTNSENIKLTANVECNGVSYTALSLAQLQQVVARIQEDASIESNDVYYLTGRLIASVEIENGTPFTAAQLCNLMQCPAGYITMYTHEAPSAARLAILEELGSNIPQTMSPLNANRAWVGYHREKFNNQKN